MGRFWDILVKLVESSPRKTACGRTIIPCSTCKADVVLPLDHWAYPSHMEDMRSWECPSCVNKTRLFHGLGPVGRRKPTRV